MLNGQGKQFMKTFFTQSNHGVKCIFIGVLACSTLAEPQKADVINKMAWHAVDSLFSAGLNQSALDTVDRIYKYAKSMDNQAQIIKAIVYRIKLESLNKEEALVNTLFKLNDEIKNSKFPATSVLHSLLAECYFHYYQRNRGRFYNRTQVPNIDFSDIQTWDLRTIVEKMTAEFELSLQNPEALKKLRLMFLVK